MTILTRHIKIVCLGSGLAEGYSRPQNHSGSANKLTIASTPAKIAKPRNSEGTVLNGERHNDQAQGAH